MKRYKKEYGDKLEIGQVYYAKRFVLTVDRSRCKGCDICKLICPREAITLKPVPKGSDGKAVAPVLDIDENKCDFHGICAAACPFSAIKIMHYNQDEIPGVVAACPCVTVPAVKTSINDHAGIPVVDKDAFPVLLRDIEIDRERCEPECKKCEEKCPLGVISVRFEPFTPEEQNERKKKGLTAKSTRTVIDVRKDLCVGCQICWIECPANAIKVSKFFEGSIRINQELCPDGCHNCLDVCPVNALVLGKDKKVDVNDIYCIYCGACINVCPKPESLELKRTSVRHTPVDSGAWNKALEKLTSPAGLDRELAAKRAGKAREAIKNLKLSR
jgi:4Fe-4S ferredoxin